MKIAVIIVRVLMGLIFTASAIVVLFNLVPVPELKGTPKLFNDAIAATGYFMPTLKGIELACGILLIIGRYLPLVTVVIFPIVLNIFLYHAFVLPEGLPIAIFMLLANLFLAYTYRERYAPMLSPK
jgi:uncharacterized membrane protein YphA (DoxX/SURF4 family)